MLTNLRVIMFILIGSMYLQLIPENSSFLRGYTICAILFLVCNHFFIYRVKSDQRAFIHILLDGLVSFSFGFFFPTVSLYLILVGVVATTLCVSISNRSLLKLSAILFIILWIAATVFQYIQLGEWFLLENMISASFVGFGAIVGSLIRKLTDARDTQQLQMKQLEESHLALSDAHQQLQAYSKHVEEWTAMKERNRMAREIHDTVGHKMTALLVQLELGRQYIQVNQEQATSTIQACQELARGALQEIRLSVRTLSDGNVKLHLEKSIRQLLEEFFQTTNVQSKFNLTGDPMLIPISLQPTILRLVQESLTNAKKHGAASTYELTIICTEQNITVHSKDNGQGTKEIVPGFGLIHMRERVEEHGGSIHFSSEEGSGFHIQMEFPLLSRTWKVGGETR